jgi:hypothetical protein
LREADERMSRLWLLVLVLVLTASGETIQPGGEYGPESLLEIPSYGVTFRIPAGWRAAYPAGGGEMILLSAERSGGRGTVVLSLGLDDAELRRNLAAERWVADGVMVQPQGSVEERDGRLHVTYTGPEGLVGRGVGLLGATGAGVIAALAGPLAERAADSLAASVRFKESEDAAVLRKLEARLSGVRLNSVRIRQVEDYQETRRIRYDLCPDHTFSLHATLEASAPPKDGFEGVKLAPRTTDRTQGRWRLMQRLGWRPTLMFTSHDGTIAYQPLVMSGEEILLDGRETLVSPAEGCN